MENFTAPYLTTSVAEFWRNWHISLTSWFKDYLYIPLGGSRKGTARKYMNKLIVFLVSGLWHGASLSFVVWGGLNGLYQIIGEVLRPLKDKLYPKLHVNRSHRLYKLGAGLVTFVLVDFTWIFFRAGNMTMALEMIRRMFSLNNYWIFFDGTICNAGLGQKNMVLLILCLLVLLAADLVKRKGICISHRLMQKSPWIRVALVVIALCVILTFGIWGRGYDATSFIYFQF